MATHSAPAAPRSIRELITDLLFVARDHMDCRHDMDLRAFDGAMEARIRDIQRDAFARAAQIADADPDNGGRIAQAIAGLPAPPAPSR